MSTDTGRQAEQRVADYLRSKGFTILHQNWRTRWCEIDIIAKDKTKTIRIVEVKFRAHLGSGSGFEYITPNKARRLRRAATAYAGRDDIQYQIDVAAVTGGGFTIHYLENAVEG